MSTDYILVFFFSRKLFKSIHSFFFSFIQIFIKTIMLNLHHHPLGVGIASSKQHMKTRSFRNLMSWIKSLNLSLVDSVVAGPGHLRNLYSKHFLPFLELHEMNLLNMQIAHNIKLTMLMTVTIPTTKTSLHILIT